MLYTFIVTALQQPVSRCNAAVGMSHPWSQCLSAASNMYYTEDVLLLLIQRLLLLFSLVCQHSMCRSLVARLEPNPMRVWYEVLLFWLMLVLCTHLCRQQLLNMCQ